MTRYNKTMRDTLSQIRGLNEEPASPDEGSMDLFNN